MKKKELKDKNNVKNGKKAEIKTSKKNDVGKKNSESKEKTISKENKEAKEKTISKENTEAKEKTLDEVLNEKNSSLFSTKEVIIIVLITIVVSFFAGFFINKGKKNKELSDYEQELISNYEYILNHYYNTVEPRDLISSGIKGMINYIQKSDPYAEYIDSNYINDYDLEISGRYYGVGIQIQKNNNNETEIVNIFENSPAYNQKLQVGDVIISINDEVVLYMELENVKKIVQSQGSEYYRIKVRRNEQEVEVKLKNDYVEINQVSSKKFENDDKKIGYIKVDSFTTNAFNQFSSKLYELEKNNIGSLIIDLRNNTGGELTSVENIVSMFLDKKNVIYQFKDKTEIKKYYSLSNEKREYPIVVLVNGLSASASELMTAALQEKYGATVIGTQTYGKGTAQQTLTLDNGEKYKITIYEWLTANGNSIDKVGIKPDIVEAATSEYLSNPTEENDNQLNKAIEYLKKIRES